MNEMYFEIYGGEKGIKVTKIDDIEKYLNDLIEEEKTICSDFPVDPWNETTKVFYSDSYDCESRPRVIIKGKICKPTIKEIVKRYELE